MTPSNFLYYYGGDTDETTILDNAAAFRRVALVPRALAVRASAVDPSTTLFGRRVTLPLGISPAAYQTLAHPDGEVAVARAAGRLGVPQVLSTLSAKPLAEVVAGLAGGAPLWFQL